MMKYLQSAFLKRILLINLLVILQPAYSNDIHTNKLLIPDFVKAQVVSDNMEMNGMDLGIMQFYTDRKFADLVSFYRQEVGDIKVSEFAHWKIISWIDNKKLNTVQATYDELQNKTHGFIALSNLPAILKNKIILGKGFPSLKSSEIINDINATDLNKKSRTIWLSNGSTLANNIAFYKKQFRSKGWIVERISQSADQGAMMMRKGANEFNLTVTKDAILNDTNVIAVIVEK